MKDTTLCLLVRGEGEGRHILLAMKKRGFGQGKWNGVGGKVNEGETVEQALVRETGEEIGVRIKDFQKAADLTFVFSGEKPKPDWNQRCHVYLATEWEGEPEESEEMRPKWYPVSKIPFDKMWPDDRHWLPRVLESKKVEATFTFIGEKGDVLKDVSLREVKRWA